jgi:hypothetical protein
MMEGMIRLNTRLTPIAPAQLTVFQGGGAMLLHPADLLKSGFKGPKLASWAQQYGIELPPQLYDATLVGHRGLLVRVGGEEIILECQEDDPLSAKFEQIFREPGTDVYRIEQQSVTIELSGTPIKHILAQTCGMNFSREPLNRIIYTRLAGASCGIIPMEENERRVYRIWIDYTLAPYLWETLVEIICDVNKTISK